MVCRTWGLGGRLCWDSFFSVWLKMYLVTPEIRLQAPENNSFCTSRVWAAAAGSACSFCQCVPALTRTGHLLRSASNSLSTLIHFLASFTKINSSPLYLTASPTSKTKPGLWIAANNPQPGCQVLWWLCRRDICLMATWPRPTAEQSHSLTCQHQAGDCMD